MSKTSAQLYGADLQELKLVLLCIPYKGKKERSVDFADEAVVDFYFLLTASVLALDSFVDGYFFN